MRLFYLFFLVLQRHEGERKPKGIETAPESQALEENEADELELIEEEDDEKANVKESEGNEFKVKEENKFDEMEENDLNENSQTKEENSSNENDSSESDEDVNEDPSAVEFPDTVVEMTHVHGDTYAVSTSTAIDGHLVNNNKNKGKLKFSSL